MAKTVGVYINADDIKRSNSCSDLEAALKAEELREAMIEKNKDFTLFSHQILKLIKSVLILENQWVGTLFLKKKSNQDITRH